MASAREAAEQASEFLIQCPICRASSKCERVIIPFHTVRKIISLLEIGKKKKKKSQTLPYRENHHVENKIRLSWTDLHILSIQETRPTENPGRKRGPLKETGDCRLEESWPFTRMSLLVLATVYHQTRTKGTVSASPKSKFQHMTWPVDTALDSRAVLLLSHEELLYMK